MAAPLKISVRNSAHFTCTALIVSARDGNLQKLSSNKFSGSSKPELPEPDGVDKDGFRIYVIPGTAPEKLRKRRERFKRESLPPREKRMPIDQDWTKVWPTAATFNPSVVPLPIRQGHIQHNEENKGITPYKYHNTELLKIPNFLHLTPVHIKKHCSVLKEFCTEWPQELKSDDSCDENFPMTVTTQDYILSGPSLRDPRARTVKVQFKLSTLELDEHARDKIIRLLGDKYSQDTDLVTIVSDRCPTRKQNEEYTQYLLTALYYESWKTEAWEKDMEWADLSKFSWSQSSSRDKIANLLPKLEHLNDDDEAAYESVKDYSEAVGNLHDHGEDRNSLNAYKQSVLKLLNLPCSSVP